MDSITLDLETRRLADEVGGWGALKRGEGGVSALVLWSSLTKRPHLFDDNNIADAVHMLEDVPVILSYNGVGFDIPVLEGLHGRKLRLQAHIDLLALVWDALPGRRTKGYGLGDVANRTLGVPKTENSIEAPGFADSGQFGRLFNYCLDDVCLVRDLARFIQENGGIMDVNGDILLLSMPPWFNKVSI